MRSSQSSIDVDVDRIVKIDNLSLSLVKGDDSQGSFEIKE